MDDPSLNPFGFPSDDDLNLNSGGDDIGDEWDIFEHFESDTLTNSLQGTNNPDSYWSSGGVNSPVLPNQNKELIADFTINENAPVYYSEIKPGFSCNTRAGASFDQDLCKALFYNGKKISMTKKIFLFNLTIRKLNEREDDFRCQIKRLTREETRKQELLDKRLSSIFMYIYNFVRSGDRDFLDFISSLESKKKK